MIRNESLNILQIFYDCIGILCVYVCTCIYARGRDI